MNKEINDIKGGGAIMKNEKILTYPGSLHNQEPHTLQ